jgi:hypothetical protein
MDTVEEPLLSQTDGTGQQECGRSDIEVRPPAQDNSAADEPSSTFGTHIMYIRLFGWSFWLPVRFVALIATEFRRADDDSAVALRAHAT